MTDKLPTLTDSQEQIIVRMLERVEPWSELHEKLIKGLEQKFDEGELAPHEILNFAKHLANITNMAESGAAALGLKKTVRKVENHAHLNVFNFTPEQWKEMPAAKRKIVEELRLSMTSGNGSNGV